MTFGRKSKSTKESSKIEKILKVPKPNTLRSFQSTDKIAQRQVSAPLPSISSLLAEDAKSVTPVSPTTSQSSNENAKTITTDKNTRPETPKQCEERPPPPTRPAPKPLGPPNWTVAPGGLVIEIDTSIEDAQNRAAEVQIKKAHCHDETHVRKLFAKDIDSRQKEKHTLYPKSQALFNNLFDFHRYTHGLADFIDLDEEKAIYNVLALFSARPRKLRGEWEDYFTYHDDSDHESRFLRLQAYMKALESFCYLGNEYLTDRNTIWKRKSGNPLLRKTEEFCCWVEVMVKDAYFTRRTLFAIEHLHKDYSASKLGLTRAINEDVLPKLNQYRQHHDELRAAYKVTATHKTKAILQKIAFKILRLTVETMKDVEDMADYTFYESCQHAVKLLHRCRDPISRKRTLMNLILDQPNVTRRHTDPKWAAGFQDILSELDAMKQDPKYSLVPIDKMDIFKPRSNAKRKLSGTTKASSLETVRSSSMKSNSPVKTNRVKFAIDGQILTPKEDNQDKINARYNKTSKLKLGAKNTVDSMKKDGSVSRPLIVEPLTIKKTPPKKTNIR